jgi:hypothetical protein
MKRRDFLTQTGAVLGTSLLPQSDVVEAVTNLSLSESLVQANTTLDQLHDLMSQKCLDHDGNLQVGAFFEVSWLLNNLSKQFKTADISRLRYPTAVPEISAGLSIDMAKLGLSLQNGHFTLDNFVAVITLSETKASNRTINTVTLKFAPVPMKLAADVERPGNLRFFLLASDPKDKNFPKWSASTGTVDATVLKDNNISRATYDSVETMAKAVAAPLDVIDSFIKSMPLLGIVGAMQQFQIGTPNEFVLANGYVIVHGPTNVSDVQKCGPSAGTRVITTSSHSAQPSAQPDLPNGFKWTLTQAVTPVDNVANTTAPAFGYFYPVKWTYDGFGKSVIGPGVVASDSGNALMFHWGYQVSARPKPQKIDVTIKSDSAGKPEAFITITAPLDVGGGAQVSMKVGCVTVPLLSSYVEGHVDPSVFTIKLNLVNNGASTVLVATVDYNCAVDISFHEPPMIDVLLNILMASFGNRLVAGELRKLANSLSVTLVDLGGLAYTTQSAKWRLGQSFRKDSFLAALAQAPD